MTADAHTIGRRVGADEEDDCTWSGTDSDADEGEDVATEDADDAADADAAADLAPGTDDCFRGA